MTKLSDAELDCLRKVAETPEGAVPRCPEPTLERLVSLGLVDKAPSLWLPLQMMRTNYRITSAGRAVLKE